MCDVGAKLNGVIPYKFANKITKNNESTKGKQIYPFLPACLSKTPKTSAIDNSTQICVKLGIKVELKLKKLKKKIKVTTENKRYKDILVIDKSITSATVKSAKLTTSNFSIGEKNIKIKLKKRNVSNIRNTRFH